MSQSTVSMMSMPSMPPQSQSQSHSHRQSQSIPIVSASAYRRNSASYPYPTSSSFASRGHNTHHMNMNLSSHSPLLSPLNNDSTSNNQHQQQHQHQHQQQQQQATSPLAPFEFDPTSPLFGVISDTDIPDFEESPLLTRQNDMMFPATHNYNNNSLGSRSNDALVPTQQQQQQQQQQDQLMNDLFNVNPSCNPIAALQQQQQQQQQQQLNQQQQQMLMLSHSWPNNATTTAHLGLSSSSFAGHGPLSSFSGGTSHNNQMRAANGAVGLGFNGFSTGLSNNSSGFNSNSDSYIDGFNNNSNFTNFNSGFNHLPSLSSSLSSSYNGAPTPSSPLTRINTQDNFSFPSSTANYQTINHQHINGAGNYQINNQSLNLSVKDILTDDALFSPTTPTSHTSTIPIPQPISIPIPASNHPYAQQQQQQQQQQQFPQHPQSLPLQSPVGSLAMNLALLGMSNPTPTYLSLPTSSSASFPSSNRQQLQQQQQVVETSKVLSPANQPLSSFGNRRASRTMGSTSTGVAAGGLEEEEEDEEEWDTSAAQYEHDSSLALFGGMEMDVEPKSGGGGGGGDGQMMDSGSEEEEEDGMVDQGVWELARRVKEEEKMRVLYGGDEEDEEEEEEGILEEGYELEEDEEDEDFEEEDGDDGGEYVQHGRRSSTAASARPIPSPSKLPTSTSQFSTSHPLLHSSSSSTLGGSSPSSSSMMTSRSVPKYNKATPSEGKPTKKKRRNSSATWDGLDIQPIQGSNPDDPLIYPCPHCSKPFTRKFNLKTHLLTHNPERPRPFTCEEPGCGKTFVRIHDLERHLVVHKGVKGWVCPGCGIGFTRKDAMGRHVRRGCGGANATKGVSV
ncbi:hypothetical protein HDV05_003675 [Chytridiales sp. JEL 0842]|nr:hypothetical protein HDV05_003675 [Chytridiales sp. JEL 0842]